MYNHSLIGNALSGLVLIFLACLINPASAASEDIIMTVEEPLNNDTYSGVANIRGWAISPLGINRIELYVDGRFIGNIPLGGRRASVEQQYPDIPGSGESGFSRAFNYSNLSQGSHTLTIRAIESTEASKDAVINFNVARLDNAFVPDASSVNLDGAICTISGDQIFLDGVGVDDKSYDFALAWRTATQDFAVNAIEDGGNRAQWGVLTTTRCGVGNLIFRVTIDGVTQSTVRSADQTNPTFEGFASIAAGVKEITASAAGICGSTNISGEVVFNEGECYILQLFFDDLEQTYKINPEAVNCNEPLNLESLSEGTKLMDAIF